MATPLAVFGPGSLYITRQDIAAPTPYNIGFVNEFSYDEAGNQVDLYGQNQYPIASARGTVKSSGRAKAAVVSGLAINAAFHGDTFSTGSVVLAESEAGSIPTTPFQVTVTQSATWDTDLGVRFSTSGLPLARVASGPAANQYSVAAGVYTFNSADTGKGVLISYAYTIVGGQKVTVTNRAIGSNPYFQLDFASTFEGKAYYVRFYRAISVQLTRAHALTAFMMPELNFAFHANDAGQVLTTYYPEVS